MTPLSRGESRAWLRLLEAALDQPNPTPALVWAIGLVTRERKQEDA